MGLGILGLLAVISFTYYYISTNSSSANSTNSDLDKELYSFEKPGQTKNQTSVEKSRFSGMSADELNAAAQNIINQADKFIGDNPITVEPMAAEQKQQIDQRLLALEQKIKEVEGGLKQ